VSQQLAIIVLVDVGAALTTRTLKDNLYLFDNMKLQGSEGEGTGDLVTAINGTYWLDGSQANEQVLNWLPYSLGSIPPTVPRNFHADRARRSDQEALDALVDLASRAGSTDTNVEAELNSIQRKVGTRTRVKSARRPRDVRAGQKVMDVTGKIISWDAEDGAPALNNRTPLITEVFGEAVDQKIMYPALYGSPDLVTDGWYWSASVDTARPGTYSYKMEIELHELVQRTEGWIWEPVRMICESRLKITTEPKRNGFTKSGMGLLPIAPAMRPEEFLIPQ
jgi:hypothetical protein